MTLGILGTHLGAPSGPYPFRKDPRIRDQTVGFLLLRTDGGEEDRSTNWHRGMTRWSYYLILELTIQYCRRDLLA